MSTPQILGSIGVGIALLLIWIAGAATLRWLAWKIQKSVKESALYTSYHESANKGQAGSCKYKNEGFRQHLEDSTCRIIIPPKGFGYRGSAPTTLKPCQSKCEQRAHKRTPYHILLDEYDQMAKTHIKRVIEAFTKGVHRNRGEPPCPSL